MELTQSVFIAIAFSGPIAIVVGIGRSIMCLDRSIRAKYKRSALLAGLGILALLALLAAIGALWFGYGVAHTGKDAATDLVVLASTIVPAYIGAYCVWRLSGHLERKFRRNDI